MDWFVKNLSIPDPIKKRVVLYLVHRYFGHFLKKKIELDDCKLDLFNGSGVVENISLDVDALNDFGNKQNLPVEFILGNLKKFMFIVPWKSIFKDPCYIELHGFQLVVQPKNVPENATSMFESMWSSMTSSMQMAEDCLRAEPEYMSSAQPIESIESFAKAIDSILARVKIKFYDISIEMEHIPKDSINGVGLTLNIASMAYSDEAGKESEEEKEDNKAYVVYSFETKNFVIEDVTFHTVEFDARHPNYSGMFNNEEDGGCMVDEREEEDDRHSVMFGKISDGKVQLRMKQSEDVSGPKVALDMNWGCVHFLISPRQWWILNTLLEGYHGAREDNQQKSDLYNHERPMTDVDYKRIEEAMKKKLEMKRGRGLQGASGWSSRIGDEVEDDENMTWYPMSKMEENCAYTSISNLSSSSMESSINSSVVTEATSKTQKKINKIGKDPTAKISNINIKFAGLSICLLHEDLLTLSNDASNQTLVASSVQQMQNVSKHFFDSTAQLTLRPYGERNFNEIKHLYNNALKSSHLRLMCAPLNAEFHETTTSSAFYMAGAATASKLELLEVLYTSPEEPVEYVRILGFAEEFSDANACLKLDFRHVEKFSGRRTKPKTDVKVTLDACTLDFDVTIVDRISALLHPQPICNVKKSETAWGAPLSPSPPVESQFDVKILCACLTLKLRFPVPDFRPHHDMQRTAWWKRSVRPGFLAFKVSSFAFSTSIVSLPATQKYEFETGSIDICYYEKENSPPLYIGVIEEDAFKNPRIVIELFDPVKEEIFYKQEPFLSQSMNEPFYFPRLDCGPFSGRTIIHTSDVYQEGDEALHTTARLIQPGTNEEISEFIKETNFCRVKIGIDLPMVSLQLTSKHVLEVLYNHISSDLLLWEPSAPKPKGQAGVVSLDDVYRMENNLDLHETYSKTGLQYDSESDTSSSDSQSDANIFYSLCESKRLAQKYEIENKSQSYQTLNLHIGRGSLHLKTPVRDLSTKVIPEQHGELLLRIEDSTIHSVTGYKGDPGLGYMSVQLKDAHLYHNGMIPEHNSTLWKYSDCINPNLHPTICRSEKGILQNSKDRGGDRDAVTIAIKIQANHETHHVKTVQIAVGVNKSTLKHRNSSTPNNWITQIIDFFTIADYPILGYYPKEVLTELHIHLWECSIDYRPLNFPIRTVLSIGSFSMSSHVTASASTTSLRFLIEDCILFLSQKFLPKNGRVSNAAVDLKRDYVAVADFGHFEVSWRKNDKGKPNVELRAANNVLMIRTCADSMRALIQLSIYIANDGDFEHNKDSESNESSPMHARNAEQELIKVDPHAQEISKSQHERVTALLDDAMQETHVQTREQPESLGMGADIFFFPGEGQLQDYKASSQVLQDLGDVHLTNPTNDGDTDDEFIFIDTIQETWAKRNKLPRKVPPGLELCNPDDYFFKIPIAKRDIFGGPLNIPVPLQKYTICDMSIKWELYDGNDFSDNKTQEEKKQNVNFANVDNVTYSTNKADVTFHESADRKKEINWIQKGGVNRDHDTVVEVQLMKVRFQHDVFDANSRLAMRQILLINDIEVIDRVKRSEINKILYLLAREDCPRLTNSYMFSIKAFHVRPDLRLKTQECTLWVAVLPLRMHINQHTLLFLVDFVNSVMEESDKKSTSKQTTPTHRAPVMCVSMDESELSTETDAKILDDDLLLLMDDVKNIQEQNENVSVPITPETNSGPIYFRKLAFTQEVTICLDYHGKQINLTRGSIASLVLGLSHLNASKFYLKRLFNDHGILGVNKLLAFLLHEWLNDIKHNQVAGILGGVGPLRPIVDLCSGIRDLFLLPIEQYQRDGRIMRGLQRGATNLSTAACMTLLELSSRLVYIIQLTAETAYDMMSPGPSVRRIKSKGRRKRHQHHQPQDIREGVVSAFTVVREGLEETAETLVQVASHEKEHKGYTGAVGGIIRQIPPTLVKPIIIASEATSNFLEGVQNQLLPDARLEANQKWKNNDR